jgi:cytochrome b561
MATENPATERFGAVAQALHWATAVAVLAAFLYGPGGSETRIYDASRDTARQIHETLGMTVLALTVLRLCWRMAIKRPAAQPYARWMELTSRFVQATLYVLLLAVPLTAIAGAWLEGHPVGLLGGLQIHPPFAPQHAAGATIAEIHTWLGDAILWVAGLHAAAAIFHSLILRDGVLRSMLPGWLPYRDRF